MFIVKHSLAVAPATQCLRENCPNSATLGPSLTRCRETACAYVGSNLEPGSRRVADPSES